MRKLIWPALFLFFLLLQGSVWLLLPEGWNFDVLVPALYFFALMNGRVEGFLAGLGIGLLQDSLTPGFFGFHMLTRCAIGYWCGAIREQVYDDKYSDHVPVVGLFSIAIKLFAGLLIMFSSMSVRFLPYFLVDTVVYVIINMLLTVPVFFVVKYVHIWADAEEQFLQSVNKEGLDRVKKAYLKEHAGLRYKREGRLD
ncbi:MAG: rod shape-determining protein MreD [Acidaminococcaceae bacterium]|nr:rod shape-determining protein MreD [Acidaminococcaceae bacterium]